MRRTQRDVGNLRQRIAAGRPADRDAPAGRSQSNRSMRWLRRSWTSPCALAAGSGYRGLELLLRRCRDHVPPVPGPSLRAERERFVRLGGLASAAVSANQGF
jgi:hypothetical protein